MAIAFASLTSGSDTTTNPSTTASISPTSGAQVFAAVGVALASGYTPAIDIDDITVSGAGLTWAQVGAVVYGTRREFRVFRGSGTPSAGALTVDVNLGAGAVWEENMWAVVEATGADGTTPIGTAATNSGAGATAASVTVVGTPDAGDFVYAAFVHTGAASDMTIGAELSNEIVEVGGGTDVRRILAAYDSTPDASPVPNVTWTGAEDWGGIAFIVNVGAAGGTNTDYSPGAGSAVIASFGPLVNPQLISPSADATDGNWTPSTGTDLYAVIDETLRSDTDYAQSGVNPSGDAMIVKLATINDPGTDDGLHLQWAAGAIGQTGQVVGSIRQGNSPGTEIAAWTHANLPVGSYQEFDDALTSTQVGNITDWSDLYLKIVAS